MNPLGILALLIALVVGYYALSSANPDFFDTAIGPIATGPASGSEIQNPQPVSSGGFFGFANPFGSGNSNSGTQGQNLPPPLRPGESPYKGKVHISTIQRWSGLPEDEYVAIRYDSGFFDSNATQTKIDVSGWKIVSARTSGVIPLAFNIPEIDAGEQDILLPPGGELVVVTGTPPYQQNFRENGCTGYFTETKSFSPSLSYSCIDENRERSALLNRGFNGACINAIQSVPSCTKPRGTFPASVIGADCGEFMVQHLSYAGCVADYRDRKNFLKNTWHVSLKQPRKMYDPSHDRIKLYDREGLLVDEFEY